LLFAVLFSLAVLVSAVMLPQLRVIFETVPLTSEQLLTAIGMSFIAPLLSAIIKV